MKRLLLSAILIAYFSILASAQSVPLDSAWFLGGIGFTNSPVIQNGSAIQFHWYDSPTSDGPCGQTPEVVQAQQPAVGYMVRPWTQSIVGSQISVTFKVKVKNGSPSFNYIFETTNTGCYPPHIRIYFQTGVLDNATPGTRWYSNPDAVQLDQALGVGSVTLTVPIDPVLWTDQFGKTGLEDSGFQVALSSPTYVGLVFGGGNFFGHGVNTSNGVAQFQLSEWKSQ